MKNQFSPFKFSYSSQKKKKNGTKQERSEFSQEAEWSVGKLTPYSNFILAFYWSEAPSRLKNSSTVNWSFVYL